MQPAHFQAAARPLLRCSGTAHVDNGDPDTARLLGGRAFDVKNAVFEFGFVAVRCGDPHAGCSASLTGMGERGVPSVIAGDGSRNMLLIIINAEKVVSL